MSASNGGVCQFERTEALDEAADGELPFQPRQRRPQTEMRPRANARWRLSARPTSSRLGSSNWVGSRFAAPITGVRNSPPGCGSRVLEVGRCPPTGCLDRAIEPKKLFNGATNQRWFGS